MAVGLILLSIVTALVLFGAAQRVLDRMQLSDRAALVIAALLCLRRRAAGSGVRGFRFG